MKETTKGGEWAREELAKGRDPKSILDQASDGHPFDQEAHWAVYELHPELTEQGEL